MKTLQNTLIKYHLLSTQERRKFVFNSTGCSICDGKSKRSRLVLDHCHTTGYIRGVLCELCNSWLGILESKCPPEKKEKQFDKIEKKFGIKKVQFQKYLKRTTLYGRCY